MFLKNWGRLLLTGFFAFYSTNGIFLIYLLFISSDARLRGGASHMGENGAGAYLETVPAKI